MKKVVISGYYGYDNIGDEALLKAIVSALRKHDGALDITVLSAQPEKTAKSLRVNAISRTNPFAITRAIMGANLVISGGGSLLQDVTGPLTIPYYLSVVFMAKVFNKPVMFYAQGVGPVNKKLGRWLIKWLGNKAELITLRDSESAELLEEIGVDKPPIRVTADPVFGVDNSIREDELDAFLMQFSVDRTKKPLAGLAIRLWPGIDESVKVIAEAADYLSARGRQVILIPMHYPVDVDAAQKLQQHMTSEAVLIDKKISPDMLMKLIGSLEMVIGMRLHALIFAALQAVPLVGISYDPKVAQFLQSPGCLSAGDVKEISRDTLVGCIDKILADREAIGGVLAEQREMLREKALDNASLAVGILERDCPRR